MAKHVTIKDIARSLCISVSTVSRALTDDRNIRKETRDMVVEEAKRLGYKRNPVAMNLKMGRTNTIGVIVPEMHTPYASQVIGGIQEILYKKNQKVMIAESDENPDRELENLKMMEQFMVDGLIVSLCSYRKNIEMYQQLEEAGMAVDGLKEYTSKASGVFMMGVFGGAVFPVLQGLLADYVGSWQFTWLIPLFSEFVILWYGPVAYKPAPERYAASHQ